MLVGLWAIALCTDRGSVECASHLESKLVLVSIHTPGTALLLNVYIYNPKKLSPMIIRGHALLLMKMQNICKLNDKFYINTFLKKTHIKHIRMVLSGGGGKRKQEWR